MLHEKFLGLEITEGPSKMRLIVALADGFDTFTPFYVKFKTSPKVESERKLLESSLREATEDSQLVVRIQSLECEDGIGESFIFTGYTMALNPDQETRFPTYRVKGCYSTKTRQGCIDVGLHYIDDK